MKLSELDAPLVKALQNRGHIKTECLRIIEREVYRLGENERQELALMNTMAGLPASEALAKIRSKKREQLMHSLALLVA
ncbi:hypothetical protein [uncultured Photobacterium sp.]|uniref:hypothetical protein n=1 Tax=uncultured Photobacterium sp. TaxID=173973 RepID=UPI00261CBE29|nr:hypothetical protein [uncultured Photobacterium sp.]